MKNNETKKLNNKGFSLVELIIVIAIMAVLIGVLAPQYIRYVEKSQYQKDMTMLDEVKSAIDTALSDPAIYTTIPSTTTTITFSDTAIATGSFGWAQLETEVTKIIPLSDMVLTSKACTASGATVEITVDANGNTALVLTGVTTP